MNKNIKKSQDILLINAPFGVMFNPYISIPTLASYLKEEGFSVGSCDINNEFYAEFITVDSIKKVLNTVIKDSPN